MSTEAAIHRGKGIVSNPAFFIIFTLSVTLAVATVLTVGISGVWGWALTGITGLLFAVAWFSGLGERLFVGIIAVGGLISGFVSAYVVFHLWGPIHGEYLWASLLAVVMVVMPVAAIAGEKVLPLFVAFVAGVWGLVSVIVFVMVVFQLGMEQTPAAAPAARPAAAAPQ